MFVSLIMIVNKFVQSYFTDVFKKEGVVFKKSPILKHREREREREREGGGDIS